MATSPQFADIKARMHRQWRPCLIALGVPAKVLDGRAHPCPACGGTDRFTYNDRDGNGSYYCRGCHPGDGFSLLQKYHRWSAKEALKAVADWLGVPTYSNVVPFTKAPRKAAVATVERSAISPTRVLARIRQLWREAIPLPSADIGQTYLRSRGLGGLPSLPANVRLHPGLAYWWLGHADKPVTLGTYPALVALVQKADGKVTGLHRTYLQPDGSGKLAITSPAGEPLPAKKLLSVAASATQGCAIHTYPIDGSDGVLAIAEGLETSLAVTLLWSIPCWPCLSESGIRRFQLPAGVQELVVCCDNDTDGVGQAAGKALARRLLAMPGAPVVKLMVPEPPGTDWLDYWNATRREVRHG